MTGEAGERATGRQRSAATRRQAPARPLRSKPAQDEDLDYGEALPLVAEWRQARAASLSRGASRVERARGGVRTYELELLLIGDHELTLPPSTNPWDESRCRNELYWGKASLAHARWELVHALLWRWVQRVLTLGLWRG